VNALIFEAIGGNGDVTESLLEDLDVGATSRNSHPSMVPEK